MRKWQGTQGQARTAGEHDNQATKGQFAAEQLLQPLVEVVQVRRAKERGFVQHDHDEAVRVAHDCVDRPLRSV